jgi:hypothetical protein
MGPDLVRSLRFDLLRRAAGLFAVNPTIRDQIRFDRFSSTSTIDQGSKAILGKSSQENKILTDCRTRFFPDCAGKREFSFGARVVVPARELERTAAGR